ncbi:MAG: MotA/TolQ/ExbB proton channel family protein [Pirellulaceae bacterium]|nr:MotA/TolQ/ExbB proton channel family protein [Pirellulaceae bacterium]
MVLAQMNVFELLGNLTYFALAVIAIWGAFCVVMVWFRVRAKRFSSEEEQEEYLNQLDDKLLRGDFDGAAQILEADKRAVPQLALLAIINRDLGFGKVRQLLVDRFQRDVLADLAGDISFALLTTIYGLWIAIPLIVAAASVNVRIRKMEDLVAAGLTRFLEVFRIATGASQNGD